MKSQKKSNQPAKAANAFDGLADMMNAGALGSLTSSQGQDFSFILISEISVKEQVREIFDDSEHSLQDLAESILEHGVFQPIVLRPISGALPFELVAGERRLRASILAGKDTIPAVIREMSEEEAEKIQLAENIQRKNLTQIEVAKRLERDLIALDGNVDALMTMHNKSRAWISKWLQLIELPPEAQRVIDENVSADLEVINIVRQVEKIDVAAAKELVDDLKATQGKENARTKAKAVKDAVKPRKEKNTAELGSVATPRDTSHTENGPVIDVVAAEQDDAAIFADAKTEQDDAAIFADAKTEQDDAAIAQTPAIAPVDALNNAYSAIYNDGRAPSEVLKAFSDTEREDCEGWLHSYYEAGVSAKDVALAVIAGLRSGSFSTDGHGAFALSAFLYGGDSGAKFSMLNIMGTVKA